MGFIREIRRDIEQEALCLMREYRSLLLAEAKQLTNDDSVAEDIVMKTIESYLAQPDEGLPAKGKVRAWLRTTLRNHFNNSVRGKARACTVYLDEEDAARIDEIAPADNSSDEAILAHSDAELVRNVLARLPQSARSVIVMHYFESLSIRQIAELLRKSPDSVKSNLYYARKVLAKRLGKMMGRAALAIAALIFGGSLLYAAAVATGLAPSPFAAPEPAAEQPLEALGPLESLEDPAPLEAPETNEAPQQVELTTTNLTTTNNEETTMNTQLVKSAAAKALAAGAMLAAAAVPAKSTQATDLPSGYTKLEYIQGDGASARLITDYTPNPQTDKIEAVIEWPAETIGGNQQVWCARGTSGTDKTYTLFAIGSNLRFDYNKTRGDLLTPEISEGVKYTVTADRYMFTWSGGNGQTHTESTIFQSTVYPLVLFASYARGVNTEVVNYGKHRLYSFKVWRSDELIHDFVPCRDPNGVATMVDVCANPATLTVQGTFIAPGDNGKLPAGYTEVQYIQGNGEDARIVTSYIPLPQTDKAEAVVEWPSSVGDALSGNQGVWCARGSTTSTASWTLHMLGNSGGKFRFDYNSASGNLLEPALSTDVKYTVTADRNVVSWSGGNGQTHTPVIGFTAAGDRMVLFAVYSGGTIDTYPGNYGKHRLYSFKVWRSGELIHYFVPCKDPNGVATMVDICYNASLTIDGTFTAGPEGHYYDDKLFRPAGTVYYIL